MISLLTALAFANVIGLSQSLPPTLQLEVNTCDTLRLPQPESYIWTSGNQDIVMTDGNGVVCGINPGITHVAVVSRTTTERHQTEITVVSDSNFNQLSESVNQITAICSQSEAVLQEVIANYQKTDSKLAVADNQRILTFTDGSPFLFLSQTLWGMARRLTREEIIQVLDICQTQGFTAIQFIAHAHYMGANTYGDVPFESENFLCPSITPGNRPDDPKEYDWWDHVEFIIQECIKRDLTICLLPTWREQWNQKNNLNRQNALAYGKFISTRFRHLNQDIIWVMGGDAAPDTEEKRNIHRLLARGIAFGINGREEYGNLMMTYHTHGPTITNDYISESEPFMDFNTIQSGHNVDNLAGMMTESYASQDKPTVDFEPLYDKNGVLRDEARTTIYWGVFEGGFGTSYGNWNIWHCGARNDIAQLRIPESFEQSFGAEIKHLGTLLTSYSMELRIPNQNTLVNNATQGLDRVVANSATDGSYVLVYTPNGAAFEVNLDYVNGKFIHYQWFNPRTGEIEQEGKFKKANATEVFVPPSKGGTFTGHDWVLILEE